MMAALVAARTTEWVVPVPRLPGLLPVAAPLATTLLDMLGVCCARMARPLNANVVRNVVGNVILCRNDTYERWSASETHKTPQNPTLRALMAVQPPEAKPRPR